MPIPQLDPMGCAVACAAFLVRERDESPRDAYKRASHAFTNFEARRLKRGFPHRMVVAALRRLGVTILHEERLSPWPEAALRGRSATRIIRVRRYPTDPCLHYVVKIGDRYVDPMDRLVDASEKDRELEAPQKHGKTRAWPDAWIPLGFIEVGI